MGELVPISNIAEKILAGLKDGTLPMSDRFECQDCFNSGYRSVRDPNHPLYKGVVKCNRCEYWNFRRMAIGKPPVDKEYRETNF